MRRHFARRRRAEPRPPPASVSSLSFLGLLAHSRRLLLASAATGLSAGAGVAALVTLIGGALGQAPHDGTASALPYFSLCLFVTAAGGISEILIVRLAQDNLCDLRLRLARHILSAPYRQLQSIGPHRLTATLTEDVGHLAALLESAPPLLIEAATLIGAFVYMGWLSWSFLLLFLAFLLVGGLGAYILQIRSYHWHQKAREATDALFGHFRGLTDGSKELNMSAPRRRAFLNDLNAAADAIKTRIVRGRILTVASDYWGKLAFFLLIGLIVFVLPSLEGASREKVAGFAFVVLFAMRPISVLLNATPVFGKAAVALRNIEELGLAVGPEPRVEGERLGAIATSPTRLELAGVAHRSPADDGESGFLLGPLDLRIEPGELLFVTGGNGAGKTTLALLILGLYPPDEGSLRLGGMVVTEANRDHYRQHFAAVFADAFISDWLPWDRAPETAARAAALLARMRLAEKVRIDDGRFSTIDLSRGQRKRLALIAAYLEDRPFYLFDEWAAEQDPPFRDIFYEELLPELRARGKTVVVITHDDRHFHLADRRIHLNSGRIEE
ncbi:cyclic peptide export ABC transporter [Methylocapsa acidiphila]|uniref:cyclic peptide export ABC transporter n=1 Tax=Methylocapsa acidiphila TaxID=133552 RepID=UPI0003F5CF28|nr:cyclic peptide export ABC transporter [Methylocapsa acidiphila]